MNSPTSQNQQTKDNINFASKINYQKSIKAQRLIHRITLGVVFNYFFFFFISAVSIGIITIPAIYKLADVSQISIWYKLFVIVFDCWMLANIYLTNKLVKIHLKKIDFDNKDVEDVVRKFFPEAYLYSSGTNILWYRSAALWFNQDITFLKNDNLLYINITGLGRGDSPVPFHGLSNYLKCKKIAKYLNGK